MARLRFRDDEYAAFLFDMDGTLLDSSAVVERTWRSWAARHGVEVEPLLIASHGVRSEDTLRQFGQEGMDLAAEADWLLAAEMSDIEGIVPIAGIEALLENLDPDAWAIVTSASRELALIRLKATGLPIPAVMVCAEDVAQGKPHPEGYRKAAQMLGAPIAECLVFEDAPAGVAAARAAGAHVAIIGSLVDASLGRYSLPDYA